jgi:uncharacterized protein YpuA (DUF1002 family)
MDRYNINITDEQYQKVISKFSPEDQERIKKMAKDFKKILDKLEENERSKNEKIFNGNS